MINGLNLNINTEQTKLTSFFHMSHYLGFQKYVTETQLMKKGWIKKEPFSIG